MDPLDPGSHPRTMKMEMMKSFFARVFWSSYRGERASVVTTSLPRTGAAYKQQKMKDEAKLLTSLHGGPGIAQVHHCGVEGGHNVMVMDLLGPSLEDLFKRCNRRFPAGAKL